MSPAEFGLNVIAGWLGNQLDKVFKKADSKNETDKENCKIRLPTQQDGDKHKLFCTFDVFYDLERILSSLFNPVAHILIEKEPSTFWNLACLVVESKVTEEWYVFRRGRMAMQGMGGGIRQSEIALNILRKYNTIVTAWALPKSILDDFEAGIKLWYEVKASAVPLFASINAQEDWRSIQDKTNRLLSGK